MRWRMSKVVIFLLKFFLLLLLGSVTVMMVTLTVGIVKELIDDWRE